MRGVMVVDGPGVRLSVHRSRLIIEDGIGTGQRHRELSRIERAIRRIIILTDSGTIALEAIRWCARVGIVLVQLDGDGGPLASAAAPGNDDARLRRAQAVAPSGPTGLQITRALIGAKLSGQAHLTRYLLDQDRIAEHLDDLARQLQSADSLAACRDLDAQAAHVYYGVWAVRVHCRFAEEQGATVPRQWLRFSARLSTIGRSTTRSAADPINALLSYGYGLAEIECRVAALAVGLDPGMGILHTDQKNRDSLALDLLEAIHPIVEYNVLRLLETRCFVAGDFYETRDGTCRLAPPLIDLLVDTMPGYATAVGPVAEAIAHALARTRSEKIELRTPLTLANLILEENGGAHGAERTPAPSWGPTPVQTCRSCGVELPGRRRDLCPNCWPERAEARTKASYQGGKAQGQATPGNGASRAQGLQSRARRSQTLVARNAEEAAWAANGAPASITREELVTSVVPHLKDTSIRQLQEATGLSASGCSMIRSGKRTPHPRHWTALAELASSSAGG